MLDSDNLHSDRDSSDPTVSPDAAQVGELRAAQEELSRTVFKENLDLSRSRAHWEEELAAALRGLEDVESVTDTLQRAIRELRRTQDLHSSRQKQFEEDSAMLRTYVEDALGVIKGVRPEGCRSPSLLKKRQARQDQEERCSDRYNAVEGSVKNVERNVVVLRGQLQNNKQVVADLLAQLDSTEEIVHSSHTRLTEVEKVVDALWDLLKEVRETLHILSMRNETLEPTIPVLSGSASPLRSLAEEFKMSLGQPDEDTGDSQRGEPGVLPSHSSVDAVHDSLASPVMHQAPPMGGVDVSADDDGPLGARNSTIEHCTTPPSSSNPLTPPSSAIPSSTTLPSSSTSSSTTPPTPPSSSISSSPSPPSSTPPSSTISPSSTRPNATQPREPTPQPNAPTPRAAPDALSAHTQQDDNVSKLALIPALPWSKRGSAVCEQVGSQTPSTRTPKFSAGLSLLQLRLFSRATNDGGILSSILPLVEGSCDWVMRHRNPARGLAPWTIIMSIICFIVSCHVAIKFGGTKDNLAKHQVVMDSITPAEYPVWEWALKRS